jgi:hypothetical protein
VSRHAGCLVGGARLGRSPEDDLRMLDDLRMPIGALGKAI